MIKKIVIIAIVGVICAFPALADVNAEKAEAYYNDASYKKAVKYARKAVKTDPGNIKARVILAESYCELKKYKKSIQSYKEIIRLEPDNTEAMFRLGIVYNRAEYHRNAEETFRQVLAREPDNVLARYRLGLSLALCMDLSDAYQVCMELKKQDKKLADDLMKKIHSNN